MIPWVVLGLRCLLLIALLALTVWVWGQLKG